MLVTLEPSPPSLAFFSFNKVLIKVLLPTWVLPNVNILILNKASFGSLYNLIFLFSKSNSSPFSKKKEYILNIFFLINFFSSFKIKQQIFLLSIFLISSISRNLLNSSFSCSSLAKKMKKGKKKFDVIRLNISVNIFLINSFSLLFSLKLFK